MRWSPWSLRRTGITRGRWRQRAHSLPCQSSFPVDVFSETINALGKKSGHQTALRAAEALLRPGSQFILIETTTSVPAALEKFAQLPAAVSYTDCVVMAVADAYDTRLIFGFDGQFAAAGYERLTPAGPESAEAA